ALDAGARMLQWFYLSRASQAPVSDKLAEFRGLARSVADWISKSPSVRNSYFVGEQVSTHDTLYYSIGGPTNIFCCMTEYGSLWQEHPEDAIVLYRKLMESPVFSYVHGFLWFRSVANPRLVSWNGGDSKRISQVWNDFTNELRASTNLICQIEAKAFDF